MQLHGKASFRTNKRGVKDRWKPKGERHPGRFSTGMVCVHQDGQEPYLSKSGDPQRSSSTRERISDNKRTESENNCCVCAQI